MRIRQGRYGWERWNGFTEEWWPLPFHLAMASLRDLGRHYAGQKLIVERWAL